MDGFFSFLYPLEWVVANIMVGFHWLLTNVGLSSDGGWTWALSIVGLVVLIRILLIPLFVKQIKASRAMQVIAPELKAVQNKYKGKKDQASREAMSRETMELYSKHKTNPFASCLPILVQAPIFFALFRVLNYRMNPDDASLPASEQTYSGIGWLTPELAEQGHDATIFGAQLSDTFLTSDNTAVKIVSAVLIIAMVATTFLTQRQLTRKNMPASALEGPMAQQQKILMYALPFIFVITGPNFPVGVLIYWTTTNLWTMGQQFYVIRNNPTPGSEAEKALKARKEAKARKKGVVIESTSEDVTAIEATKEPRQRQQPKKGAPRSQRKKGAPRQPSPGDAGDESATPDDADDAAERDAEKKDD
ncbi:membrane protein insertase YidC [Demequina muriae]|uniref:Membrane protein insertase YidC n=1 Tax=Demequina muriae TaxID=3051664 RepID=A0ABT8GGE3_9MICO|nr:membrane protein insertase YidC [Demequina sp. EGI L300058]MDN4480500.1 membrane protein insertase YidC [Demequina sp. EGI L300058]